MPYVQSPSGTIHEHLRWARRTKCGRQIYTSWSRAEKTDIEQYRLCSKCEISVDYYDDTRSLQHPNPAHERTERKIREMQRQCSQTPKIG